MASSARRYSVSPVVFPGDVGALLSNDRAAVNFHVDEVKSHTERPLLDDRPEVRVLASAVRQQARMEVHGPIPRLASSAQPPVEVGPPREDRSTADRAAATRQGLRRRCATCPYTTSSTSSGVSPEPPSAAAAEGHRSTRPPTCGPAVEQEIHEATLAPTDPPANERNTQQRPLSSGVGSNDDRRDYAF